MDVEPNIFDPQYHALSLGPKQSEKLQSVL
jgi:hypothetical protein